MTNYFLPENAKYCEINNEHLLKISKNNSVWRGFFNLQWQWNEELSLPKMEELALPFSSGFIGKYFFSEAIGSGFAAEGKKKLTLQKKK